MTFLKRLVGSSDALDATAYWRYGRFSDAHKSDEQLRAWEAAVQAYEAQAYHDALGHLLDYLRNDDGNNILNLVYTPDAGMRWTVLQGSKQLEVQVDAVRIMVEAKVAETTALDLGFMQQLMERNYSLIYSRFALDTDNNIVLRFDSKLVDASPYKLLDALREVAINADKLDDLLLERYDSLRPVAMQHIVPASPAERAAKQLYWRKAITDTLDQVQALATDELAAGRAYLLLYLGYKLDYLVKPEGVAMETIERIHRRYFAHDRRTISQKCQQMQAEYRALLDRPATALDAELYDTISTFGITMPVGHERLISFIQGELPNTDWYLRHGYDEVAIAITGYIAGYCAFEFALPKPDRALLHLYFEVMEAPYFEAVMGQSSPYLHRRNGLPHRGAVKRRLRQLTRQYQGQYPQFALDSKRLRWESKAAFACSYMEMLQALDLSPAVAP